LNGRELRGPFTWARADVRSRWRSLVALGVLAGLAAGLALAVFAGARRTDTALARLRERNNAADAIVFPSQAGAFGPCPSPAPDQPCAQWDRFERLDYLEDSARWALSYGRIEGMEGAALMFYPLDEGWLGRIEKPLVVDGRMFDPDRHDEAVVDERFAKDFHVGVGSRFVFTPFAPDQEVETAASAKGPRTPLRVVGVVRTTNQFLFVPEGLAYLSPGFVDRNHGKMQEFQNGVVRLAGGASDSTRLKRDASEALAPGTVTLDLNQVARRVTTSTDVERTALLLLAVAVAVAGVAFIGQSLSRSAAVVTEDREALQGSGFTRAQLLASTAVSHALSAGVALTIASIAAVALSPRFPIGLAGEIEPDRGLHFDALVLLPGLAALPLLIVVGAAAMLRLRMRPGRLGSKGRTGLLASVRRIVPLPIGLGTTMALIPGRGRSALPVRPALLGAVVGILGIVAALTLHQGLTDALDHPERIGVTWDAEAAPRIEGDDQKSNETALRALAEQAAGQRDVGAAAIFHRGVSPINGNGVPLHAVESVKGDIGLGLIDGRAPAQSDEAAIGPATARQLGVSVGDSVTVGQRRVRMRIVGRALFPSEVHGGFDEGLWITIDALGSVREKTVVVRWRDGVDETAALERFQRVVGPYAEETGPAALPAELTNLKTVKTLPIVLVAFLAVLAASTLAHVLAAAVRRRRHELAVYRTLGFTRRMIRTVLRSQGTTTGSIGLAVGIPLGLALGRLCWKWLADQVPLQFVAPFAVGLTLLVIPAAIIIAMLLAVLPGRGAVRLRPAEILRTE